jgi:hypothetical protein
MVRAHARGFKHHVKVWEEKGLQDKALEKLQTPIGGLKSRA